MYSPFFPDPIFGWACYVILVGLTAIAAVIDLRTMKVPKWLTLGTLAVGVALNLTRGIWLGIQEQSVWVLVAGPVTGALDGLLFSLCGFLTAFGLFFVLWFLGTCGGGDVKLLAAVGPWIGPRNALYVVAGTLICVVAFSLARLIASLLTEGWKTTQKQFSLKRGQGGLVPRGRLMTFSLPVAVATAAVLLWVFRFDLQLEKPRERASRGATTHALT